MSNQQTPSPETEQDLIRAIYRLAEGGMGSDGTPYDEDGAALTAAQISQATGSTLKAARAALTAIRNSFKSKGPGRKRGTHAGR